MLKLYTTQTCAYCKMLKQYLTVKGKEFEVIDLTDKPELHQRLIEKTGVMTVPILETEDEQFVIGFNRQRLAEVL